MSETHSAQIKALQEIVDAWIIPPSSSLPKYRCESCTMRAGTPESIRHLSPCIVGKVAKILAEEKE